MQPGPPHIIRCRSSPWILEQQRLQCHPGKQRLLRRRHRTGTGFGTWRPLERTAQLPRLDLQIPKRIIGRNTEECILSGTIVGMAAMLDGMVQRIEAELGSPATLILTGGAARFVEPLVLHPHIYDPNLLLKGLAFLCERNCAKIILQILHRLFHSA